MTLKVELLTTQSSFDELHSLADGHKATVKVGREALLHLLMDHTKLVTALRSCGANVTEPIKRERLKLGRAAGR